MQRLFSSRENPAVTLDLVGLHFFLAEKTPKISLSSERDNVVSHRSTSKAAALRKVIMTIAKVAPFAVEQVSLQASPIMHGFQYIVLRFLAKILWSANRFSQNLLGRLLQCLAYFVTPLVSL